ncbi:hypothetical protein TC41_0669 [Alicyclobacillus acidocaldarius subsp. acidocaldarius Tc-4-1]|uniref:Uncharacterized protein n=1 Tax=Alicyclobacillus acidocaldarius (strain Tc-4-1) TaxID=1048834 RepID=F8IDX3_ALIAT|nr:hypothetical protein TC41_0669 [Alicyclobacillus acidocaldarius subsp. acidocaldarius Tc-4-1]
MTKSAKRYDSATCRGFDAIEHLQNAKRSLSFDRLHLCSREIQFELAARIGDCALPLYKKEAVSSTDEQENSGDEEKE